MSHSESAKNVKKTQVVCSQRLTALSYFACTRPSDFYFRTMAFTDGFFGLFVNIIQNALVAGTHLVAATPAQLCERLLRFISAFYAADATVREPTSRATKER